MKLHINDQKRISEVQAEFTGRFPFLKLLFFRPPHTTGKGTPRQYLITDDISLKEAGKKRASGEMIVQSGMTVSELENQFRDQFGLSVQVFRQSGSSWLETTATDSWTLEKQNQQGKDLSELRRGLDNETLEYDNI